MLNPKSWTESEFVGYHRTSLNSQITSDNLMDRNNSKFSDMNRTKSFKMKLAKQ